MLLDKLWPVCASVAVAAENQKHPSLSFTAPVLQCRSCPLRASLPSIAEQERWPLFCFPGLHLRRLGSLRRLYSRITLLTVALRSDFVLDRHCRCRCASHGALGLLRIPPCFRILSLPVAHFNKMAFTGRSAAYSRINTTDEPPLPQTLQLQSQQQWYRTVTSYITPRVLPDSCRT